MYRVTLIVRCDLCASRLVVRDTPAADAYALRDLWFELHQCTGHTPTIMEYHGTV